MQWRRDAYTLDTDRQRLDMPSIVRWLQGTYWAGDRPAEAVQRSWDASGVVFGLYHDGQQVGCARVLTDFVTVAYLADVFLVPEHRGMGIGLWMVQMITAHPDLHHLGWLLRTRDSHSLYRRVGFTEPGPRLMERPRP